MKPRIVLLIAILAICVFAQETGNITGRINDAEIGKTLSGANVRIESLNRSAGADTDGRYSLRNIPAGVYSIKVSHIGYSTQIIDDVEVQAGMETALDIRLVSSPIMGRAVEVSTPTRRTQLLEDTPEITLVVRDIDIERVSPCDISEVVAYVPGVSVEGGTGSGQPYDKIVSINGLPAHYSLVMMDGARIVSSHWHTGANINIVPPEAVEQVEVVKGAASAQYGSEGLGGALNIITKRGGVNPRTLFTAYGGSRNTQYYSLINNGSVNKDVRYNAFAGWEKTDGDSVLAPAHRLGELGYDKFTLLQNVDADLSDEISAGAQMFYMSSHSSFRGTDYESWLITPKVDLDYAPTENLDIKVSGYYTRWNGEINSEKNEIAETQITLGYGGFADNYLLIGGEYIYRNFRRTSVEEKNQTATGFFFQHEWSPGKLSLLGAVRYDRVENIDGVITPKLTAKYSPVEMMDLRLSIGRGFRAPTVQDLYEESYGHGDYRREGNPDLKPEYSTGVTGGMEFMPVSRMRIFIDGYYTAMTDMITPIYDHTEYIIESSETSVDTTELDIYIRQNIHKATIFGGEIKLSYYFFRDFAFEGAFNCTHNENMETGKSLPYYPGMTASAKLSGYESLNSWFGFGGYVGMNFAMGRKVWNWNDVSEELELEDYIQLDAGLNFKFDDRYEIFGMVDNILSQEIHTYEDLEMITAGIPQFKAGVRLRAF